MDEDEENGSLPREATTSYNAEYLWKTSGVEWGEKGEWKENREKESNKLILNRGKDETGEKREKKRGKGGNLREADVSRFHDNIPRCLVINAAGR